MFRLRSYFSTMFRRVTNYISTNTNTDLSSLPTQTFNYLQIYFGNNLQYVLFISLLLLLFLLALVNDSNDAYIKDVHKHLFESSHDKPILTIDQNNQNYTIDNVASNLIFETLNTTNNKQSLTNQQHLSENDEIISLSNPFWFSMLISIIMWVIFIQILKYIRQRTISMIQSRSNNNNNNNNRTINDTESVRMLAQLMSIGNRFPNGLSNRLRIALLNRDFTADDYEMLQILDDNSSHPRGAEEGMINRLPVHTINANDLAYQHNHRNINDNQILSIDQQHYNNTSNDNSNTNNDNNLINDSQRFNNICNICLEPYILNDEVRTILCLHKFHKNCIDQWLRINAICPICKHNATE